MSPIDRLLIRFAPRLAHGPRLVESIWTSRLDGTGMRLVGSVPASEPGDRTIHNVQWLPSGRRVSFVYRDTLYSAPAY